MNKLFLLFISFNAFAAIEVVTTLPEFKWVVDQIGKEHVSVKSLLSGNEDPHYIDAVPSFIVKSSKADLLVKNGMQLETGWVPKVIQMAGNSKIKEGNAGHCDASADVDKANPIKNFNRSMGDVHPAGNPHYSLSVVQMKNVANTIFKCLSKVSPKKKSEFKANLNKTISKLNKLHKELKEKAKGLKGKTFMTYHLEFVYFFKDFGLNGVGTLEKVPGVLPSAAQLLEKSKLAKKENVDLILASTTNPRKYLEKFKEITGVPYTQLNLHMSDKYDDYIDYQKSLLEEIVNSVNQSK
ncbi:MAG: metal ion ABC transporter substrate-binding protein [Halobacteriovoraceae bacterium]|nr:metal ion ABC transporter substrate-binding protein [Halobacteriovoraceae bacterium]|tara:strand:+ start:208783 stop:209670 length:888 start_codon:yes stop_codon:yes gene_type:complete